MKNLKKKYIRTDLAAESGASSNSLPDGAFYSEAEYGRITVARLEISKESAAKELGKSPGHYVTVSFPSHGEIESTEKEELIACVCNEIKNLAEKMHGENISKILVAGLGNRKITSDALGPLCTDNLHITRHLNTERGEIIYFPEVSALAPGVLGQTGIETLELIKGATERCSPDIVIVVDALASRSVARLARTVQLSSTGISPGSGIGNHRKKIDTESVGYPVMAIGVPTVVDSATLVLDALERAGISEYPESLTTVLEEGQSFFVTLKDTDLAVNELASIIFEALNRFFAVISDKQPRGE